MFICALSVVISVLLAYLNGVVKPILWRECEAYAKTMLTEVVSEALATEVAGLYFNDTMQFTYNAGGYVSSYSLNMLNANKIRAYISKEIISVLSRRRKQYPKVSPCSP